MEYLVTMKRKPGVAWFTFIAGLLLLGYGAWALHTGSVISTWGQMAYRPNVIYWITVAAFEILGGANVLFGFRCFLK